MNQTAALLLTNYRKQNPFSVEKKICEKRRDCQNQTLFKLAECYRIKVSWRSKWPDCGVWQLKYDLHHHTAMSVELNKVFIKGDSSELHL